MLKKIFGPLFVAGYWRSRTNEEVRQFYGELDIVTEIRKGRLRWLGHVERMSEERVVSNGKLTPRTCPGCSVPEPYRSHDCVLDPAKPGLQG